MANMYLLLRDGRQSGPFTIGELLQQQVTTTDMIWIEGKSTAWCYLSEMQLMPAVAEKTPDHLRVVPPSGNEDEIERKAEELRKRALAYVPQHDYSRKDASSRPYKRQPVKNEEEVFHFVDHRKKRNTVAQEILMSVFIIGIFAASIYGGKTYFNNRQEIVPVAHKMESVDNHTAIANPPLVINKTDETTLMQDSTTLQEINGMAADSIATPVVEKPKTSTSRIAKKKIQDTTIKTEPIELKADVVVPPPVNESEDLTKSEITTPEQKDTAVQVEKKKKGFRLFKKKKKDDTE